MKNLIIIRGVFLSIFVSLLLVAYPWSWYLWSGDVETFMAIISTDTALAVSYKFLPIELVGEQEVLRFYILWVAIPAALSFLFALMVHSEIKNRHN